MASANVTFDILARDRASKVFKSVGDQAARTDQKVSRAGSTFGKAGKLAAVGLGAGLAAVAVGAKKAITAAAEFDKTIRTVGATTGETGKGMAELSRLALKMGADTVFSADDASKAMLELAKGGITAAQIKAGALASTLTLAAAGSLDMATAAGYMSNALNTFGLKAEDGNRVAAALAGAANASTASVESLGLALSQGGGAAKQYGLSIEETTAALAAFDNAGIKGSDAGTSLKTMLLNLVPTTKKASKAMKEAGFSAIDSSGNLKGLASIAEDLKDTYGQMSKPDKIAALKAAFGTDAFRAAAILSDLGAKGVEKYTKATSDLNAAQRLAKVGTEGAAGAMEAFKGSIDTLLITVGLKLLPTFTKVTKALTSFVNGLMGQREVDKFGNSLSKANEMGVKFGRWLTEDGLPAAQKFAAILHDDLLPVVAAVAPAFGSLLSLLTKIPGPALLAAAAFISVSRATKGATPGVTGFFNAFKGAPTRVGGLNKGLKGLMGTIGGGPWGVALGVGAAALALFIGKQAKAKAATHALAETLNEQTGAVTKLSEAQVVEALRSDGTLKAARALGISLRDVTKAALGNEAAQKRVNNALAVARQGLPKNQAGVKNLGGAAIALSHNINKLDSSLNGANKRLRTARQEARDTREALGLLAKKPFRVTVDTSKAVAAVAVLNAQLRKLGSKVHVSIDGVGTGVSANAGGVRNFKGGLSWVGERGPELVRLPKGSDVYTNGESERMTAGTGWNDRLVREQLAELRLIRKTLAHHKTNTMAAGWAVS